MNTSTSTQPSKRGTCLPLVAGLLLIASQAPLAGETEAPAFRLRPSHEELVKKRSTGPSVGGVSLTALAPEAVAEKQVPTEFLKRSTILAYRGNWTIVPKNAVMFIPPSYEARIVDQPEGTLLPWSEFYVKNRNWLHCQNVRISDARGKTTLNESVHAAHETLGRVVVATLKGGPISMPPVAKPLPPVAQKSL